MIPEEIRQAFLDIKTLVGQGEDVAAFSQLVEIARPEHEFVLQSRYVKLIDECIAIEKLSLRALRIAILATSTVDHLSDVFRFWLACHGFAADIHIAQFDTVVQTVLDEKSDLYAFTPDIVWFFNSGQDVSFYIQPGATNKDVSRTVGEAVDQSVGLWKAVTERNPCDIIQNNADIADYGLFSNFEGSAPWTRRNLLRRYNLSIAEAALPGVAILDFDHLSAMFGKSRWLDRRYWYHSKHTIAFDAIGLVANHAARVVGALKGMTKKCLVCDLDGTLWGGFIGDDGLEGILLGDGPDGEAFIDFQRFIRGLKERGIMLAVCSKNEDEIAREPFERHPDMQLSLKDFSIFCANWHNKADNIRDIVEALNIGLDSVVFVDDNPVERALVRRQLPEVSVLEMPDDPSQFIPALCREGLFETTTFSKEDVDRNGYYQAIVARDNHRQTSTDLTAYLESLDMVADVGLFDDLHLPRIAQLINKTNQFHLTGTRYGQDQVQAFMDDSSKVCRFFKLRDRFGDNGLISAIIMDRYDGDSLFIDTWVMSCRVFSRGMEEFIINELVRIATELGSKAVRGRYVPSKKNKVVADLYGKLGFENCDGGDDGTDWILTIGLSPPHLDCHIAPR